MTPFACDSARPRRVRVNGLDLAFLESGVPGRPGLCLLHGGAAHAHWFDRVASALAERFHVVALDQRGHGESAWAVPPAYSTEAFAADLAGLMVELGWTEMILVGHSMGGHNAMAFAAWHPERVRALAVLDARPAIPPERLAGMHTRGRRPPRQHETLDVAARSFRLLPPDTVATPELLAHLARASFAQRNGGFCLRFDPACYAARQPADGWPLLERIAAPTLIVRGGLSPILPHEMAERMLAAIPRASLVEIPGAYHHLVLDRPDEVSAAVGAFLGT